MTDPSPHLETLREHAELRTLGPSERFERLAETFYRTTGFMAPGKSLPLEMGGMQEDEDRQKAWDVFVAARSEEFGKALAYAIRAIKERRAMSHETRETGMTREQQLRQALEAVMQFVYPGIDRGPAINGWQNSVALATEALERCIEEDASLSPPEGVPQETTTRTTMGNSQVEHSGASQPASQPRNHLPSLIEHFTCLICDEARWSMRGRHFESVRTMLTNLVAAAQREQAEMIEDEARRRGHPSVVCKDHGWRHMWAACPGCIGAPGGQ